MSKQRGFRWTSSKTDKLRKAAKNYNAKLTRLGKKDPLLKEVLPERVSMKDLKSLIIYVNEFRRTLSSLRNFTQRGAERVLTIRENEYEVKLTKYDNTELAKALKNYNAKITRLEKKYEKSTKIVLPKKMTMKDLKKNVDSRKDFEKTLNSLREFTKRGSEELVDVPDNDYNLKMTKWQRDEMLKRRDEINVERAKRKAELEEIQVTSRGQETGYTVGDLGMGEADEVALRPINAFTPSQYIADVNEKFDVLMNESRENYWNEREQMLKNNYIDSLHKNFRENDIKGVVEAIEEMDFKEFYKIFKAEGGNFEPTYPPNDEQYSQYLEDLRSTWIPVTEEDAEADQKDDE